MELQKTQFFSIWRNKKRYQSAIFFSFGIAFDFLTLGTLDDHLFWASQGFYLFLGILIWIHQWFATDSLKDHPNRIIKLYFQNQNNVIHFILGGLLSQYMVLYFKSASMAISSGFIGVILVMMVINELPRFKQSSQITKSALFGLCITSFSVCLAPALTKQIGTLTFFLAAGISLLITLSLYFLFLQPLKTQGVALLKLYLVPQLCVLFAFVGLYAFKILPPVPLAIQHIGVYHVVEVTQQGQYLLKHENPWWRFWHNGDQQFAAQPNDQIYVFFRLFSPHKFDEALNVVWDYRASATQLWQEGDRIPLKVKGGRSQGYRAFVKKQNYETGNWRVRVLTQDLREVGRIHIEVNKLSDNTRTRVFSTELH